MHTWIPMLKAVITGSSILKWEVLYLINVQPVGGASDTSQ